CRSRRAWSRWTLLLKSAPRHVRASALATVHLFGELGGDVEQITDNAEVRDLEDRRLRILVHRHDRFRCLHSGTVLNRAGNSQGDIELRRNRLTGLSHLELCGVVSRVDRRT